MLCVTLKPRVRICGPTTGGVSDLLTFDPFDFDFTQAVAVEGVAQKYSAIALRTGSGATATATVGTGAVTAISVSAGGTGYVVPPTVVIGGPGTGATATANINGLGVVTSITVTAPGTGYSTAPAISFTGGGAVYDSGAKMFAITFKEDECEYTYSRADSNSSSYEHNWAFQLEDNDQSLTTLMQAIDAASYCCGIGIIFRLNSGKIFVAGERFVGGTEIPLFKVKHGNTDGTTGKVYEDFNGANMKLKAKYSRALYEYSGTWASIQALQ